MIRLLTASVLATSALLIGATGASASATMLVPEYSSDTVYEFSTAADGALTALAGSPFSVDAGGTTSFVVTPDARFGFATYLFAGGVRPFSVSATGAIAPVSPKLASAQAYESAIAPSGKTLYVATRNPGGGVRAWDVATDGTLLPESGSPYSSGTEFFDVVVTPDGRFVYAAAGSQIVRFGVNSDGSLAYLGGVAVSGAQHLMVSPDGAALFATTESSVDEITSFKVSSDGTINTIGSPWLSEDVSTKVPTISPDGRFLYQCDGNSDKLYVIAVNADHSVAQVGDPIPFEDCQMPVVTNDGKFLYLVHTSSAPLAIFQATIGADGRPGAFTQRADYSTVEPLRISFLPGQGTTAAVQAKPASKPLTMRFDGGASKATVGEVGGYEWAFGDGASQSSGSPITTHTFAKPGVYSVALTASDQEGCSGFVYDGHYARCNGTSAGTKTLRVDTPPWITSLKVSPSRVGSKTKIKFKLTEAATVTFAIQRPTAGRTVGGSCKRQTAKNRKFKKCTRWVTVGKKFSAKGKAKKTNSIKFTGSVKGKKLGKGSYRFSATAKDKAKGVGPAATAKFKIRG